MLLPILKTLHVIGAVLFLGAGLGSAFYKWRADRSGDLRVIAWCQHQIVLADWLFTVPSGVVLPVTGIWMARLFGWALTTPWIAAGIAGYVLAGLLWLPAAFLQIRMREMADAALAAGAPLPDAFHRANRTWLVLGAPAFVLSVAIVFVMVGKWAIVGGEG